MTSQEIIDRDLRILIGDLQVQLIFARARIVELEQMFMAQEQHQASKPNGLDRDDSPVGTQRQ